MVFFKVRRLMATLFFNTGKMATLWAIFGYTASCYFFLYLAGEHDLIALDNFAYWLMVTASTVGYGDMSPSSTAGKLIVGFWVIPLGLSLFALFIAKAGYYLSELSQRKKRGLRMLKLQKHTVIIGWNESRTLRLIELLQAKSEDSSRKILLCSSSLTENPLPGKIEFVHAEYFSHDATMARANLAEAERIIIDSTLDDVTLTTALYCEKVSPGSHKTAYFKDQSIADLLRSHCPNIETIPSVDVEMLAKSALDPGSSQLHKQLLDSTYGMTQYAVAYPYESAPLAPLFDHFKHKLGATIIGVKRKNEHELYLNPPLDHNLECGDSIYYIAENRLLAKDCFSQ